MVFIIYLSLTAINKATH